MTVAPQQYLAPPQQYLAPPQQYPQQYLAPPQYQTAPQQYQTAPQQYSFPMAQTASQPMMQPMAASVDPVDALESQIKAMKEYVLAMEKTLKEVKKTTKKRTTAAKDPMAPPKEMSAGVKAWNQYLKYVREEESVRARTANPALGDAYQIPPKMAMEIAKQRKAGGDPKWPEYQSTAPKAAPAPKAPKATPAPKAAPALTITAPATFQQYSFPMAPIATNEEEETELEEVEINGKQYLFDPSTAGCWLMNSDGTQGAWAGKYDGASIDDSADEE